MRARVAGAVLLLAAASATGLAAAPADRLDRFRALVGRGAGAVEPGVAAAVHALVDAEILDSLAAGGPFASEAFLQERLDAFTAVWGGARFTVRQLPAAGVPRGQDATVVAVYAGPGLGDAGSVRVFSVRAGRATLAAAMSHEGEAELHEWPAAPAREPQFALAWHGQAGGSGARPLRVEVWRAAGGVPAQVWSTAEVFPEGLVASDLRVARGEVRVRYEARYAGRKPGCAGQTEHEDLYGPAPPAAGLRLLRRRVIEGWHRELHESVTRLFAALAGQDRRTLAELVPDPAVRARLPLSLAPDPACEGRSPEAPGTVSVAATEARPAGPVPWAVRWRRQPGGWRVVGAAPVLE